MAWGLLVDGHPDARVGCISLVAGLADVLAVVLVVRRVALRRADLELEIPRDRRARGGQRHCLAVERGAGQGVLDAVGAVRREADGVPVEVAGDRLGAVEAVDGAAERADARERAVARIQLDRVGVRPEFWNWPTAPSGCTAVIVMDCV
jgi:hypothetical protein